MFFNAFIFLSFRIRWAKTAFFNKVHESKRCHVLNMYGAADTFTAKKLYFCLKSTFIQTQDIFHYIHIKVLKNLRWRKYHFICKNFSLQRRAISLHSGKIIKCSYPKANKHIMNCNVSVHECPKYMYHNCYCS